MHLCFWWPLINLVFLMAWSPCRWLTGEGSDMPRAPWSSFYQSWQNFFFSLSPQSSRPSSQKLFWKVDLCLFSEPKFLETAASGKCHHDLPWLLAELASQEKFFFQKVIVLSLNFFTLRSNVFSCLKFECANKCLKLKVTDAKYTNISMESFSFVDFYHSPFCSNLQKPILLSVTTCKCVPENSEKVPIFKGRHIFKDRQKSLKSWIEKTIIIDWERGYIRY